MSRATRKQLTARIGTAMQRFMAHAVLYQDAVAQWAGLHATDLQCAGLLLLDGPMTPGELAARTGITNGGAITAVIDRMVRAGVVARTPDPTDRRRVQVVPDADALTTLVGPVYARIASSWERYLAQFDEAQLALVIDVLDHAAQLNRDEVDWLRSSPRPSNPPDS